MSAGRGITCWRVNQCSLVAMASVCQVWMALCEAFDERGGVCQTRHHLLVGKNPRSLAVMVSMPRYVWCYAKCLMREGGKSAGQSVTCWWVQLVAMVSVPRYVWHCAKCLMREGGKSAGRSVTCWWVKLVAMVSVPRYVWHCAKCLMRGGSLLGKVLPAGR